jgi:RNA ligase (TIGR02306 family)
MENQNSVCFVARIGEVKPIEGADNIEVAVIGGWNCIVPKGQYSQGYLAIVATTDAVIPEDIAESIGVTNYLRKGNRVRTVKLRGVYSECLVIPAEKLPVSLKTKLANGKGYFGKEGEDVMELLGIYKYEPPAVQVQLASGRKMKYHQNPNFGIYYKFPNIKNVKGMFDENDEVEVTRKLHGTNARYGIVKKRKLSIWDKVKRFFGDEWVEFEYVYGSHNVEKGSDTQGFYDTDVWKTIAEKYNIREKLWHLFKQLDDVYEIGSGIVIYGEIYGPGIQKNYDYGLKELEYAGFDVTINGEYKPGSVSRSFHKMLGLEYVPVLEIEYYSEELLTRYTFDKIEGTKVPHEGVVIKSTDGNRHKVAKIINPDYLIYGEKHNVGDSH